MGGCWSEAWQEAAGCSELLLLETSCKMGPLGRHRGLRRPRAVGPICSQVETAHKQCCQPCGHLMCRHSTEIPPHQKHAQAYNQPVIPASRLTLPHHLPPSQEI